ncbi:MerR family transcriptional regulator [Actinomadura miaoliensis]|uniref:MerR family transcriptional regulator n=2 Tax=Actinomadura miaoliensis TaxID=430685 RepID=A0ABP7WLL5_9ACTN
MRISQLAERTGVPATTLRFYESAGLLPADRTPAGYRVYGQDAVERLAFIGAAKDLGLPLEEIAELLRVWAAGACAEVKAELRPRVAARLTEVERRVAELTALTVSLRRALAHLDALPDRSRRCDPRCGFPGSGPPAGTGERWRREPVACSLSGDGMAERAGRWREVLDGAEREEIDDGVRLTLPADRTAAVAALAADEQRCCPFFDFRLHLDGPVVRLEARAPADAAGLLAALFT